MSQCKLKNASEKLVGIWFGKRAGFQVSFGWTVYMFRLVVAVASTIRSVSLYTVSKPNGFASEEVCAGRFVAASST